MRVAVCVADIDERYTISRHVEEVLLQHGVLSEMMLYPMQTELFEAYTNNNDSYDVVIITSVAEKSSLKKLCNHTPVIFIGEKSEGPKAFDIGAAYFIEKPADLQKINKALVRCI